MAGRIFDLYIDQGADYALIINLQDDSTHSYMNLVGYSFAGNLRTSAITSNIAGNLTCSVGNTANGQLFITMDSGNTINLVAETYLYNVWQRSSTNAVSKLLEGRAFISPAI